jgi:hypothetical protein
MSITTHPLVPKKYIDLSYQGLNDTNIDELLLDVLQANATCLTQLNLYGNRLTFNNTNTQLVMAIGACTSLKVLSLGDNNIGPEGATNIAHHIIAVTTSLVELHIGDNQLGDVGTTSIAHALCANDTIEVLGLYNNHIGDVGALALANTTLSSPSIVDGAGSSGGSATNSTNNTTVVREIWLHNNHIGNVGGKAILEALRSSSSNSMDATAAPVVKNGSVEDIFLINNKISSDISTDICTVLADRKKKKMTPVMAEDVVVVVKETMKKEEEEEVSTVAAAAAAAATVLQPQPTSPTASVIPPQSSITSSSSSAPVPVVPPSSPTAEQVAVVVREALSRDVINTLKLKDIEITKLSTALELERERSRSKDDEIAILKAQVMQLTAKPEAAAAVVDDVTTTTTPPPVVLSSSSAAAVSLMNEELPFIVGNVSLKDTSTAAAVVAVDSSNPVTEIYEDARDETEENSNNDTTLHVTISVE